MGNGLRRIGSCLCDVVKQQVEEYVGSSEQGYSAFCRDILHFESTGEVPEGLANYVQATRATQIIWYRKLLAAWKEARLPPSNASQAAQFILDNLQTRRKSDLEGILQFYGLQHPVVAPTSNKPSVEALYPTWPKGVQYEFTTLPVEGHNVADGDTITVFVDVNKDPRESKAIPRGVLDAVERRRQARSKRDFKKADILQQQILDSGYKVFDAKNGQREIVGHKYRIRLRGVDAPESNMPHGPQSKAMLISLVEGQKLRVYVYTADQYGRLVADVHTNHGFVQEILLKKGCVWHYSEYDKRAEFAQWEQEARRARMGLWAFANPQKPWEYRKERR